jgi:hypothetical protein
VGLTSVEAVRQFLETSSNDAEEKKLLEVLIARVSAAISNYTHREFEPTEDERRVFAHPGGKFVDLAPYDVRTVETVEVGTENASPTTLGSADYALRPLPSREGVYQRIRLGAAPQGACEIAVKGDWGFAEVPADVEHAAITTIALWLRREVQAFERTFSLDQEFLEKPEALPSAVRGILAPYRRPPLP